MDVTIRHDPSFAVARCALGGGEVVRAESGAMMATSDGVSIEASMQGGLMKSLRRGVLGGESLFITTYTAPPGGGWVDVAAHLPGDMITVEVGATPLFVQRGSYIASEAGVELDTKWGGFKSLFGGEGGFLLRASGHGEVVLSCYGALDRIRLVDGETVVVQLGPHGGVRGGRELRAAPCVRRAHRAVAEERRGLRLRLPRARRRDGPEPQPGRPRPVAHDGAALLPLLEGLSK